MPYGLSPRFGVDRTVQMEGVPHNISAGEEYKLSFALLGMQASTPWISVASGAGRFLSQLELGFMSSGGEILGIRWTGEYIDEPDASPPRHINLRLVWDKEKVNC